MSRQSFLSAVVVAVMLVAVSACSSKSPQVVENQSINSTATPAGTPLTGFAKDLDYVRKGQYTYVWVFSRKDSKPLDKEDAAYLRKNAPQVVDWVTTDEGKKVIAGTNFDLELGNMALLKERFVVEDFTSR